MVKRLTRKQEQFVDDYCKGGNGVQAVVDARYRVKNAATAAAIAYENLRKPQIAAAIAKRKAEIARKAEESLNITVERQLREYEEVRIRAMEAGQLNAANHALDSQSRIIGAFEADNTQKGGGLANLLQEALKARMAENTNKLTEAPRRAVNCREVPALLEQKTG